MDKKKKMLCCDTEKKKYLSPIVSIRYLAIKDIITTSPIDTDDEYEGEMDWNML